MLIKAALSIIALAVIGRSYLRLLLSQSKGAVAENLALSWLIGAGVLGWMAHLAILLSGRVPALLWVVFGSVILVDATIHYRRILSIMPSLSGVKSASTTLIRRFKPRRNEESEEDQKRSAGNHPSCFLFLRGLNFATLPPLAFLILQCAVLVLSSLSYTRGWDGVIIWDMKAKAIYFDSSSHPGALMDYFNSPAFYPHLDYPLLLPSANAWVHSWVGTANQQALKLIGPAFMITLLALLVARLRQILPTHYALFFVCLLTTTPYLVNLSKTGYADIPLATMAGAAAAYGADYLREQTPSSLLLMLLFTGFSVLIKKEGILIAAVMIIAMTLALIFARKAPDIPKFLLKAACILSLVSGPWLLFLTIHKIPGGDFAPVTRAVFIANWNRFAEVIAFIPKLMSMKEVYGGFWLIAAVTVLTGIRRWNRPHVVFLGLICIGYLAAISASYIFSAWYPYWPHVESSLSRLLLHVAPIVVLFAGHSVGEQFFKK